MFRMKWQKRGRRKQQPTTTARRLFHGVAIVPGPGCTCAAALEAASTRYLADEAPRLPLEGCSDPARCRCRYQHFEDRRTEPRRETDIGMPPKFFPNDIREGHGRRVTDG